MDKHAEIELKFAAAKVSLKKYHEFVQSLCSEYIATTQDFKMMSYKAVFGTDTYFVLNGQPLRFRNDEINVAELTYKQRKSTASIANRVEINLPFRAGAVTEHDIRALIGYLGGEEDFAITKNSYIYHLKGAGGRHGAMPYNATLALYDVEGDDLEPQRFLEIEIESNSECNTDVALKALDRWRKLIQNKLKLGKPLNKSLFEMYTTKAKE